MVTAVTDRNLVLDAAAERLGIPPLTLRRWTRERRLPFLKMGKRVMFKLSDLEAFERASRVEAQPRVSA